MSQGRDDQDGESARPSRSYRVEALAKGLRLLSYFTREQPALRVKDLVAMSSIPMPTVFRLVATLEEEGYLERTADGRVRPGTSVLALGFAAVQGLDVVESATPVLRELAAKVRETVNLGVLYRDQVLFVARVPKTNQHLAADIRVGSTVPAVFSSIGKVLLSSLSETDLLALIRDDSFSGRWGPKAVRTLPELQVQLAIARRDGYLMQQEEAISGLSSIAAPIRQSGDNVVAAVNVAVPTADYDEDDLIRNILGPLLEAAAEVSRRLGGRVSK